ncbi:MAG: 4Fe-4S binding protein [Syntrophales bacterium]|nr:4Fe-4S binding protein [Syntrophales bacterium]
MTLDIKKGRIATQCVFFLLFLLFFLFTRYSGSEEVEYPVKIFLDMDPLIFISTSLATRKLEVFPHLALVILLASVFLGRFFCGWICPLGTISDFVGFFSGRWARKTLNLCWLKYTLLVFLIVTSLFSLQFIGFFDPLALLVRTLTISVYPLFGNIVDILMNFPLMSEFLGPVRETLREKITLQPPFFKQGFLMGVIFGGILTLNFVRTRFWCRYVCPLGAFFGFISLLSPLKLVQDENCNGCGLCKKGCPGRMDKTECYICGSCLKLCPERAIRFCYRWEKPPATGNFFPRRLVLAAVAGVIVFPLFKVLPGSKRSCLRPPGVVESDFLQKCVRCGACMKVCPTNGLQPAILESGLEGLWTPVLYPRLGYCEYHCTLCGQVCPTGAIRRLTLEEKKRTKIGVAIISKDRCLPYAFSVPCIVCEEVCPTSKKSIRLETVLVKDEKGGKMVLKRPVVDEERCVGCGMCENKCPVLGKPAIEVVSVSARG